MRSKDEGGRMKQANEFNVSFLILLPSSFAHEKGEKKKDRGGGKEGGGLAGGNSAARFRLPGVVPY
jgi:hypothetical protein